MHATYTYRRTGDLRSTAHGVFCSGFRRPHADSSHSALGSALPKSSDIMGGYDLAGAIAVVVGGCVLFLLGALAHAVLF